MRVRAANVAEGRRPPLAIHQHQRPLGHARPTRHVDERGRQGAEPARAVLGSLDTLQKGELFAADVRTPRIERRRHEVAGFGVDEPVGRDKLRAAARHARLPEHLPLAGVEGQQARVRAVSGKRREENRLAVWQDARVRVTQISLRGIGLRQLLRDAAGHGDAPQAITGQRGGEHDGVVRGPGSGRHRRRVADLERRAAAERHTLKRVAGVEAEPFAVRREKGRRRAFGAPDRRRVETIERAQEHLGRRAGSHGHVRQPRAVLREREGHRGSGNEVLARAERDRDAREPRRCRPGSQSGPSTRQQEGSQAGAGSGDHGRPAASRSGPDADAGGEGERRGLVQDLFDLDAGVRDVAQAHLLILAEASADQPLDDRRDVIQCGPVRLVPQNGRHGIGAAVGGKRRARGQRLVEDAAE